ncbi:MAG: YabP/YqfC family sporulation protein [Oscillospiraceae bacterium]|jgi:sporulation protein YqfC|nr:YabP/YqfC family sporulation protein [Oscillospiraceae bacterium]
MNTKPRGSVRQTARQLGEALDLPGEVLPGFSHLELLGNRQAIVDGVKGVIAYSDSCVRLNLGELVVSLEGAALCIRSYQMEQVILSGVIAALHFANS